MLEREMQVQERETRKPMGSRQRGAVVGCLSPSHYTFRETLAKRGLARGGHAPVLKGGRAGAVASADRPRTRTGPDWCVDSTRGGCEGRGGSRDFEKENPKFVW